MGYSVYLKSQFKRRAQIIHKADIVAEYPKTESTSEYSDAGGNTQQSQQTEEAGPSSALPVEVPPAPVVLAPEAVVLFNPPVPPKMSGEKPQPSDTANSGVQAENLRSEQPPPEETLISVDTSALGEGYPIKLIRPLINTVILSDDLVVQFEWEKPDPARKYTLQISNQPDFSKNFIDRSFINSKTNVRFSSPGTYYWRVFDPDNPGQISTDASFQLQRTYALQPSNKAVDEVSAAPATATKSERSKDAEFWIMGGIGENFQHFQQNLPGTTKEAKFQNLHGPSWYIVVGMQGKTFGAEASHRQMPGKMASPLGAQTANGEYNWKIMTGEMLYKLQNSNWRLRAGLQHQSVPFMVFTPAEAVFDVKSNTLTLLTAGLERKFTISENLQGAWQLRYQHPIASGTNSSDMFKVNPVLALDNSVGALYKSGENFRLGLFWFVQYHDYGFSYEGPVSFDGRQTQINSNVEMRAGWEF